MLKLKKDVSYFYLFKRGDTLSALAEFACFSPFAYLETHPAPTEGELIILPECGNKYLCRTGDDEVLLCGSKERFHSLNGDNPPVPGMTVRI